MIIPNKKYPGSLYVAPAPEADTSGDFAMSSNICFVVIFSKGEPSHSTQPPPRKPDVWDNNPWTVMSFQAGGVRSRNLPIGSLSLILPSSTSIITAVAVKGLVTEAISKTPFV